MYGRGLLRELRAEVCDKGLRQATCYEGAYDKGARLRRRTLFRAEACGAHALVRYGPPQAGGCGPPIPCGIEIDRKARSRAEGQTSLRASCSPPPRGGCGLPLLRNDRYAAICAPPNKQEARNNPPPGGGSRLPTSCEVEPTSSPTAAGGSSSGSTRDCRPPHGAAANGTHLRATFGQQLAKPDTSEREQRAFAAESCGPPTAAPSNPCCMRRSVEAPRSNGNDPTSSQKGDRRAASPLMVGRLFEISGW